MRSIIEPKIIFGLFIASGIAAVSICLFIFPPRVSSATPINGSADIDPGSSIVINFDKPVKREQLEHFIAPNVYGEWKFENPLLPNHLYRTLTFTPVFTLKPDTRYTVRLKNIENAVGTGIINDITMSFRTSSNPVKEFTVDEIKPNMLALAVSNLPEPMMTILAVPMHFQDYALSCEAAALKMALNFRGHIISEDDIMNKIGYDLTSRKNNIWGDPNKAFVGDIDGISCRTGYGVYWDAVRTAAKTWNNAESFSNWNLADLTKELRAGNPVLVWGTLPVSKPTDCSWTTPEGKYIKAFKEAHVRVAIGYVGSAANPEKIILNDSLSGTIYWTADEFMKNWKNFDYSGVVIR